MCSKIEQININDMFDRAMSIKQNTVITYTDLMTNKEIEIWNELHVSRSLTTLFLKLNVINKN